MPYALGDGDPRVWIIAGNLHHNISVRLGAGDVIEAGHEIETLEWEIGGTEVSVWLPETMRRYQRTTLYKYGIRDLVRGYHLFNPHATVSFSSSVPAIDHGESDEPSFDETEETHTPTDKDYKKFTSVDPLAVHWFDSTSFIRLIRNYVSHDEDLPVGDFIKKFRGFSDNRKVSAARKSIPDALTLSALTDDDAIALHVGMRNAVKEPSHNVLGDPLGEAHLVGALRNLYGDHLARSWYKLAKTELNGAPAIVEAAIVDTPDGELFYGLNHAPTYDDPLASAHLRYKSGNDTVRGFGIRGFLQDTGVLWSFGKGAAIAVHITAAAPATTDRGKTTLSLEDETLTDATAKVLWLVSKELYKEAKKRERDAAAAEREAERREKREATKRIWKSEACSRVMDEAYAYSTGNEALPTTARDLYYAVRNRIDRFGYDADELDYAYFSQTILPDYQRNVKALPLVEYEPRGILYEPHGGDEVRLGTRSVADYDFPDYVYNKILYIEKNGRVGILRAAKTDARHDMALIGGQGYASEAIRTLFESAEEGEYQLFVLHDADPSGYSIARTLREETARMPGYSVDVIDIGLKLEDALALGKRPETYTRKNKLDGKTEAELTAIEREHFIGEERKDDKGKPYWISHRVELNDLSSPQLVEYVEGKLREHDALGKVIPEGDALKERREALFRKKVGEWVESIVDEMLGTGELKEKMVDSFEKHFKLQGARAWVETGFKSDDTQSWRDAVKTTLQHAYDAKHKDALRDAVQEHIRDAVAAEEPEGDE